MKNIWCSFLLLSFMASLLFADGKMFPSFVMEEVTADIPYQRAIIIHDEGAETLILQSKYSFDTKDPDKISDLGDLTELAWVVPVPAVPEIASMDFLSCDIIFWGLNYTTAPRVTFVIKYIMLTAYLIFIIILAFITAKALCAKKNENNWYWRNRSKIVKFTAVIILIKLFCSILFMPALSRAGGSGVDIIDEVSVGMYDVKVIKSDSSDTLVDWLNSNGFAYNEGDITAFDNYIERGWCFVTARVKADYQQEEYKAYTLTDSGLPSPLILRFASELPLYPMVLTGTGGFDTEVLIYLFAESKMSCDQLELRFSSGDLPFYMRDRTETDPPGFFDELSDAKKYWLTKFKSTLTPAEMTEDIVFHKAPDSEFYREHIVKFR